MIGRRDFIVGAAACGLVSGPARALPFDGGWQVQTFPRRRPNVYRIRGNGVDVLSEQGVSLLLRRVPEAHAGARRARWTWEVSATVPATDLTRRGGDDRNLALYFVLVPEARAARLRAGTLRGLLADRDARTLVYVWGDSRPARTILPSPYLRDRGVSIVLRSAGTGRHDENVNLARDHEAVLLEQATGQASLSEMARSGRDDEATAILCDTAARLHAPRPNKPRPHGLIPLARVFAELEPAAATHGGILSRSLRTAGALLGDPRDETVLHGDLHHDNVLDFGARGWLAIDPKFIVGERAFDFANIFTNPDLADPTHPVATLPGRFETRLEQVARHAKVERERLLRWILAWTGLSAAWFLGDDDPLAGIDLTVAELAAAELDR